MQNKSISVLREIGYEVEEGWDEEMNKIDKYLEVINKHRIAPLIIDFEDGLFYVSIDGHEYPDDKPAYEYEGTIFEVSEWLGSKAVKFMSDSELEEMIIGND